MKTRSFSSSLAKISIACRRLLIVAMVGSMSALAPTLAQSQINTGVPSSVISQETLDGLLAPIALYPDALLAQVLIASTYPMDVIEAARWQQENSNLSGQALQDAMAPFNWDPSVKSLVAMPQVLQYMNSSPRWLQDLGQAVIADQPRIMASVQVLRQKARDVGTLASNDRQIVQVETDATTRTQYIAIAPASPQVVYVPVYDPYVVYGNWWWPSRPVFWGPPPGISFTAGFYWGGPGFSLSIPLWGGFRWGGGMITINAPIYSSYYRVPPPIGPSGMWRRPVYAPPVGHYYAPPHRPPNYAPSNNGRAPSRPPYAGQGHVQQPSPSRPQGRPQPGAERPHANAPGNNPAWTRPARVGTPPAAEAPRGGAPSAPRRIEGRPATQNNNVLQGGNAFQGRPLQEFSPANREEGGRMNLQLRSGGGRDR